MIALALMLLLICLMFFSPIPLGHRSFATIPAEQVFAFSVIAATIAYLLLRRD